MAGEEHEYAHEHGWGGWIGPGLGLAALGLYGRGLCRDLYWYDSAEYVAAAVTLGVPHPPGYPLYTLLAHGFTWLPLPAPLAVNLLSAASAALAVTLAYRVGRQLGAHALPAAGGAVLLAGTDALWTNAVVAEVYAAGLCFSLGVLSLLLRAREHGRPAQVKLAAFVAGLGLGVHLSLATLGLGFAVLVGPGVHRAAPSEGTPGSRRARVFAWLRLAATTAPCTLLGYALAYLYVPLRAGAGGVPDHAVPVGPARTLWLLLGGNYGAWFTVDGPPWKLALRVLEQLGTQLGPGPLLLALIGLLALARRRPAQCAAVGLAMAGNLAFFARYRVDDLEVFLLPSVALGCICAGLAAHALAQQMSFASGRSALGTVVAALLLVLGATRIGRNFAAHDMSEFHEATRYADQLERELPVHAVILDYTTPAEWKYATVFAMYHQGVLGRRRDVVVARNLGREPVARLLAQGRPVYMFARVEALQAAIQVRPEGAAWRVVALGAAQ